MYVDPSGYKCKKTGVEDNVPIPQGSTYVGKIYRNVNSAFDPLDMNEYTVNSNRRYTKPGTPGLYFSSGEKIVYAEVGNYDVTNYANRTMYAYDVKIDNMLDVTNPNVRNNLDINLSELLTDDYRVNLGNATTHQVGDYALQNGYSGIIAPSARADGEVNIIIFDPNIIK